jgi:outer membrane beta-barrel protein
VIRKGGPLVLVVVALLLSAGPASAQESALDGKPPVMNQVQVLEGRHYLGLQFGATLSDPYVQNLMAGLAYRYYFTSWLGLGVDVWAGGGVDTSLTDDINRELSLSGSPFELGTSSLRLLAGATVEIVPFVGKVMFFGDEMARIALHIDLGVGVAIASGTGRVEGSTSVSPNFGVGLRFYPSDWLSVGVSIRDHMVNRVLASRKDGSVPGSSFDHNWLLGLSVGFSFPTEPGRDVVAPAASGENP